VRRIALAQHQSVQTIRATPDTVLDDARTHHHVVLGLRLRRAVREDVSLDPTPLVRLHPRSSPTSPASVARRGVRRRFLRLHQHVDLVILELLRVIARAECLIEILMTKPRVILAESLGDELRHATPHLTRIALHPRVRRERALAEQTLEGVAHRARRSSSVGE
jgi:hypothetical protein